MIIKNGTLFKFKKTGKEVLVVNEDYKQPNGYASSYIQFRVMNGGDEGKRISYTKKEFENLYENDYLEPLNVPIKRGRKGYEYKFEQVVPSEENKKYIF